MKVGCYIPLNYGKDYLGYAIKSIYDEVDRIKIFYTPIPSYGHVGDIPNPETEQQLRDAAYMFGDPKNKIEWTFGSWNGEVGHRGTAEQWGKDMGYDIMFTLDYDEIWYPGLLAEALEYVAKSNDRIFRVPMIHFWKSFNHVCRDVCQPSRFLKYANQGENYVPMSRPVYHFGYAINDALMEYKWSIHGHKNELRKDWFEKVWYGGRMTDVHPTNEQDFWMPEKFDKNTLPQFMHQHPYFDMEKIK